MRTGDIQMNDPSGCWIYRPASHKTQHHGRSREIPLGPRGQELVTPFLRPDLKAFLFQPAEAEAQRRALMHARRKTPLSCGNVPGSNVKAHPERAPGDCYTVESYGRAVKYACAKAFPAPAHLQPAMHENGKRETHKELWARLTKEQKAELRAWRKAHHFNPHRLRHSCATRLRRDHGIDLAQTILGHRLGSAVTEVYAEANVERARQIVAAVG
jgi:hypothetical protein